MWPWINICPFWVSVFSAVRRDHCSSLWSLWWRLNEIIHNKSLTHLRLATGTLSIEVGFCGITHFWKRSSFLKGDKRLWGDWRNSKEEEEDHLTPKGRKDNAAPFTCRPHWPSQFTSSSSHHAPGSSWPSKEAHSSDSPGQLSNNSDSWAPPLNIPIP